MKSIQPNHRLSARLFIFFSFCLSLSNVVLASHAAGGQITYRHLAGNVYSIRYTYFRDCQSLAAPASIIINVSSVSCAINQSYTALPIAGTGQQYTLPCPGVLTTCMGGTALGFQRWEYEVSVPLPSQCPDWLFSFTDCCRFASITTLQSPGGEALISKPG